jgi:nucleoside-triphosphatase THEP1
MQPSWYRKNKQTELQQHFQILSSKIGRIREAIAIETDTASKFKLEHQLGEAEAEREQLVQQLEALERGDAASDETRYAVEKPTIPTQDTSISITRTEIGGKNYRNLIGRDGSIAEIVAALQDGGSKWIIGIDGMGGIGKTALAREIVDICQINGVFDSVVWKQAPKQEIFMLASLESKEDLTFDTVLDEIARQSREVDILKLEQYEKVVAVQRLLKQKRVLIVLDNLETAEEDQDEIVAKLLSLLYSSGSKALLTSRRRFRYDVYSISLGGLDTIACLNLARQEASEKNRIHVANAGEQDLIQIAHCTGGSPLAIKLVIGQLGYLTLSDVIDQLQEVQTSTRNLDQDEYVRFYRYIFVPSWLLLSRNAQQLLLAMTHFAPGIGGSSTMIQNTSKLDKREFYRRIEELWMLSLAERNLQSLRSVRYFLHPLTRYFVLSDIVRIIK